MKFPQKIKNSPTSGHIFKRMKSKVLQRYLPTHVHCSIIHNSQVTERAQNVHEQVNRYAKCGIYIHSNIIQPYKGRESYHVL
jgi:hypothetical protein